ncbi:ABC transporter substrate-binding protein [Aidingimonas lacisalsi]|uniref:ABC transporter substrate-binding protein n=1 Tax=Aidingimonas lacisalsi TaxID=2604086 RepID=UPI0011D1E1BB|nr:iron-siderophore ABC transporter substrate-binding protein [Aidingimonas lacisalsi]
MACSPARSRGLSRRTLLMAMAALGMSPVLGHANAANVMPRVVTLFQGATDTAVALGVIPVGVVESWQDKPVYPYLREALADVSLVGLETQPSLEDIVLLAPDVIIASRFRHARIAPLLSRIAPVVMLDDIFRFRTTLEVMGRALAHQREASLLLTGFEAHMHVLRSRLAAHFAARWPVTVSLLDIRADELRSYLPDSFGGSVLRALGFVWNQASQEASGISLRIGGVESLPKVDADVFFVIRHSDSPAVEAHYKRLTRHPLWQRMAAPREGRVIDVDPVAWVLAGGILGAQRMLDDIEHWLDAREALS